MEDSGFNPVLYKLVLGKAEGYTDSAVSGIAGGISYKGAVNYYSDLPNNAEEGDAYTVKYEGSSGYVVSGQEYVWGNDGGTMAWIPLGPDMSQYQKLLVSGTNIKTINNTSILGGGDIGGLEVTTNKVTSLSALSTDTQYPSAKCVYDIVGNIETLLASI